jgi:hypothetical protein
MALAGPVLSRWALASGRDVALASAVAGLGHAALYGGLLFLFGRTLLPGRVAFVTALAQRINPRFRPAMVPYTRRVTCIWSAFFAAQLAGSALLLALAPLSWWLLWVGTLHGPMAAGLGIGEFLIRRRAFPGEHTGFRDTIRGIRATSWTGGSSAAAGASRPAADCRACSGNATRRPGPAGGSARGPAA